MSTLEHAWQIQYEMTCQLSSTASKNRELDLLHMAVGISDEAGEVLGQAKKAFFQGHPWKKDKVIEEVGDLLFYLNRFIHLHGVTLSECIEANVVKLNARYPNGWDPDKSLNRDTSNEQVAVFNIKGK